MWLFKRKKKIKESDFKIIHFPITDRYFPQYKGKWFNIAYHSGIIYLESYFPVAQGFNTEEQARKAIQMFKEQNFKENVKVINVD